MAIELSNLTFTEQDDIVPQSGVEQILNTAIANTLAGNDRITGSGDDYGFKNIGTLNTTDGNDTITGFVNRPSPNFYTSSGIVNSGTLKAGEGNDIIISTWGYKAIVNFGTLEAGEGNDIITGTGYSSGIDNYGTLTTEEGNDIITGTSENHGINNYATLDTGEGNDIITGTKTGSYDSAMYNSGSINTSDGNDIIAGIGWLQGILNVGIINAGNGENSIISQGNLINLGGVFLGDGNDLISVDSGYAPYIKIVENFNFMGTGNGNDTITSTGPIYNQGVIETGNGDDSIIVELDIEGPHGIRGINNYGGAINMGDGNDSIIANDGFESAENSSGAWFLEEGEDYIKGFGSGDFYGGNGNDTLELTPGTYTVGVWGEGGDRSPIFTKSDQLMITSEFERLIAGGTIYDFASLTAGQIITVA